MSPVPTNGVDDLERLSIKDPDPHVGTIDRVEELLLLIRGKGEAIYRAFSIQRVPLDERFLDERSVELEHLKPVVRTVSDIDEVIVRNDHSVHGRIKKRRRWPFNDLLARRILQILGFFPVRSPVALVGACVRIEDDDTAV